MDIRLPAVSRTRRGPTSRIKWWEVRTVPELSGNLSASIEAVTLTGDAEADWNSLSSAITRTASACLGRTILGAILTDRQAWFWTNAVQ